MASLTDQILAEHLEELGFLWGQREQALETPDADMRTLHVAHERLDAHLDGLLLSAQRYVPLAKQALAGDDPGMAFAGAVALLLGGVPDAATHVLQTLQAAPAEMHAAFVAALARGSLAAVQRGLEELLRTAPPPAAVAAAEALAWHGQLSPNEPRLAELLQHESPELRSAAWRCIALSSASPAATRDTATSPQAAAPGRSS